MVKLGLIANIVNVHVCRITLLEMFSKLHIIQLPPQPYFSLITFLIGGNDIRTGSGHYNS